MATQIGKAQIFGFGSGAVSALVTANLQTLNVTHMGDVQRIRSQTGDTNAIIASDEVLECEFDVIPQGANAVGALTSAAIPALLSAVTTTGLPVVAKGTFTDALNATAGNPWIYEGGARQTISATGASTLTLPLRRYPGITSATPL